MNLQKMGIEGLRIHQALRGFNFLRRALGEVQSSVFHVSELIGFVQRFDHRAQTNDKSQIEARREFASYYYILQNPTHRSRWMVHTQPTNETIWRGLNPTHRSRWMDS